MLALTLSLPLVASLPGTAAAALPRTEIAQAHAFQQPLYLTHAGDARLFVVEQGGRIKIIHPNESVTTFLDLSSVVSQDGGERGLLGMAFHPNYAANGLFYVNYTRASDGDTIIAEYRRANSNADRANPNSRRLVLRVNQPASNHNGGWMAFRGQNMFIAMGDGGGEPGTRAQNLDSLLGKILRINPLDPPGSASYSVSRFNPYVGRAGRDEIWSRGLRNPSRCSFDRLTGDLWCGDVGQGVYEEVNHAGTGKGLNFGWQLLEGRHYYSYPGRTRGELCTSGCKTLPIIEYTHEAGDEDNCSVTGGYVSRREGAPLYGQYLAADFCSGRVWAVPEDHAASDPLPAPLVNTELKIASFGEDVDGRLYIVDLQGTIHRLDGS
jgi:glucose/arabinose dehydrogenase